VAAVDGRGSLVLVSGEAGIGKTTLAEAFCREAIDAGGLVLVGRCYDLTETPPYGPWLDLFAAYHAAGDLLPPVPLRDPDAFGTVTSQAELFRQTRDFLAALATSCPVVLLLDDLHWADTATLDLLRFLGRSLASMPLVLLATFRDDELTRRHPLSQLLPTLVRESAATRIELRRIAAADIRTLIDARYALSEPDALRLTSYLDARSEGNPFFLSELLHTLEAERVLDRSAEGWRLTDLSAIRVPTLLRQVIEGRLAHLDEETQRLLAVAAVVGQEVPLDLWAAVAECDEQALVGAVEQAVEAHLVVVPGDGTRIRFVHALIREALYEGILPMRGRVWHRRAGEWLATEPHPDPDAVAYHLRRAGDARAAQWLITAAERAYAILAWATARDRFEAALALLGEDAPRVRERAILLFRLSVAARHESAKEGLAYIEEAARLAKRSDDPELVARIQIFHGTALCQLNDFTTGVPLMRAGLAALEAVTSAATGGSGGLYELDASAWRLSSMVLQWLALAGYTDEVEALAARYHVEASAAGDEEVAWDALSKVHLYRGDPVAGEHAVTQSLMKIERMGDYHVMTGNRERLLWEVRAIASNLR
jgi:predicted ATPase